MINNPIGAAGKAPSAGPVFSSSPLVTIGRASVSQGKGTTSKATLHLVVQQGDIRSIFDRALTTRTAFPEPRAVFERLLSLGKPGIGAGIEEVGLRGLLLAPGGVAAFEKAIKKSMEGKTLEEQGKLLRECQKAVGDALSSGRIHSQEVKILSESLVNVAVDAVLQHADGKEIYNSLSLESAAWLFSKDCHEMGYRQLEPYPESYKAISEHLQNTKAQAVPQDGRLEQMVKTVMQLDPASGGRFNFNGSQLWEASQKGSQRQNFPVSAQALAAFKGIL